MDEGDFKAAQPLLRSALAIDQRSLGQQHPAVALDLSNLGSLYLNLGSFAEAESLFRQALAIDEKNLAPDDPRLAVTLNNLGAVIKAQARYEEAEGFYQRSGPWGSSNARWAQIIRARRLRLEI